MIVFFKVVWIIIWVILVVVVCYFLLFIIWLVIVFIKNNIDLVSIFGFVFGEFNWVVNWYFFMVWIKGMFLRWVFNLLLYLMVFGVVGMFIFVFCGYVILKFWFLGC